jgi:hypothetical protein
MRMARCAGGPVVCMATLALLAGCSSGIGFAGSSAALPNAETGLTPLSIQHLSAMTMPHYVERPVHPDRGGSWMSPLKSGQRKVYYVSDWATDDVFVYAYPAGKHIGTLTGFSQPYGQCADANADIWIANFSGSSIVEYANGGTKPIATLQTSGAPIGCAVSPSGDLAVANYTTPSGAGDILVFKNASGTPATYSNPSCLNLWPPGYDNHGNLYVEGEAQSTPAVCELPANGSTLNTIAFNQSITSPGSAMWDGQYIALTDQEYGAMKITAIYQASNKSSALNLVGTTELNDKCNGNERTDVPQPFIAGTRNTPRDKEGFVVLGGNLSCPARFDYWPYPIPRQDNEPIFHLPKATAPAEPYGQGYTTLNKTK